MIITAKQLQLTITPKGSDEPILDSQPINILGDTTDFFNIQSELDKIKEQIQRLVQANGLTLRDVHVSVGIIGTGEFKEETLLRYENPEIRD